MAKAKTEPAAEAPAATAPVPSTAPTPSAAAAPAKKSNKTVWIVVGVLVFVFVVLPLMGLAAGGLFLKSKFGSQKATDKTVSSLLSKATGSDVDVSSSSGSVSVKGDDGTSASFGGTQKLPSDFPKSSIVYLTEKEVTFVMTSTTDGKKTWSLTTTVSKSFDEASAYFDGKIKEPDYTDVSSYGSGTYKYVSGKNSKYSEFVTISQSDSSKPTNVSYVITEE